MFRKKRKNNPLLFTISAIGAGALAYYMTKEAMQKDDHTNNDELVNEMIAEGLGKIDL